MRTLSIKIPNVSESLEQKLEALILGGAFWPDQPLASERRLAEEFDVSRTSLRNALGSLRDKGLLTLNGKRYHATNVMADLLVPGLQKIATRDASHLLDYWLVFFQEAVLLARKKAQNSDKVALLQAVRTLKQSVAGEDVAGALAGFETLNRVILDGCYNFFLSQTHYALQLVMAPYLEASFNRLCSNAEDASAFIEVVSKIGDFTFDQQTFHKALKTGLSEPVVTGKLSGSDVVCDDPKQLVEVVLRHPLSIEAVYELRLIAEKHAAVRAATNADTLQRDALMTQLDEMTVVADNAPANYSRLDTALHRLIAECSQNPVYPLIDAALAPVFSRTTNQWLNKHMEMRSDQSTIHRQHTQIIEAIADRNADKASEAMQEHLAYVLCNLRKLREQDHLHEIATARRLLG